MNAWYRRLIRGSSCECRHSSDTAGSWECLRETRISRHMPNWSSGSVWQENVGSSLCSCLFWKALVVPEMGSAYIQHQQSFFKWNWNPISTMRWYSQTSLMSFLTCHEPPPCWEFLVCQVNKHVIIGLDDLWSSYRYYSLHDSYQVWLPQSDIEHRRRVNTGLKS